jgi:DNA (cytosine-5)-methyltransferase 1
VSDLRIAHWKKVGRGMKKLRVLDLFAGIGGFSLGLERTGGFETVAFCEIEEFPRKVLAKHWPEVPQYDDVRTLTSDTLARDGIAVDVITGGFPCQDLSASGAQAGIGKGTRSGLFRQMLRLAASLRPEFVIFENVSRFLSGPKEAPGEWFGEFLWSLAEIGYDAEWFCITAASIGAPHERDRVWVVAYPNEAQLERGCISRRIYAQHANFSDTCWGKDKPGVERASNGVPKQMDRLGCLGNAVVPQIPEMIGHAILESERAA